MDLHPHNLLVTQTGCFVIDLDSFRAMDYRIFYGFSLYKLLRQHRAMNSNFISTSYFIDSLGIPGFSYTPKLGTALLLGCTAEILRRLFVIVDDIRLTGDSSWCHVTPVHLRGLFEADQIFSN